ncbi:hypothetical protein F4782DRAFT_197152 [Xylaria castorea]|nr:hypothetical protein F4782DRAFT_197152 [Xylaria castorea]
MRGELDPRRKSGREPQRRENRAARWTNGTVHGDGIGLATPPCRSPGERRCHPLGMPKQMILLYCRGRRMHYLLILCAMVLEILGCLTYVHPGICRGSREERPKERIWFGGPYCVCLCYGVPFSRWESWTQSTT